MARRRFRHKRHTTSEVELNMAAMLDMAFQLLAFFVLTFRPAPVEGQLALNLPPPVPLTNVQGSGEASETSDATGLETLPLSVALLGEVKGVDEDGEDTMVQTVNLKVGSVQVVNGLLDPAALARLDEHLKTMIGADAVLFDRMQIATDGRVRYGELMKVLDVCRRQRGPDGELMQDISIVETGG